MVVLKAIGPPGSPTFIAFCLLLAVIAAYVWPRDKRLARRWLWCVVGMHLFLALPLVAKVIGGSLPRVRVVEPSAVQAFETLFVFDGDNRVGRVRTGAQAASASPNAQVRVVGGDPWIVDALVQAGVDRARITHDGSPRDTRQQISDLTRVLAGQPPGRTALIASRLQIPRIAGLVRSAGLQLDLMASPIDTEPPTAGWRLLMPSYYALRVSRDGIYEHLALAYYTWRGWIPEQTSE